MSTKQVKELVSDAFRADVRECPATEQVTAKVIDHGERVAVVPVAHEI